MGVPQAPPLNGASPHPLILHRLRLRDPKLNRPLCPRTHTPSTRPYTTLATRFSYWSCALQQWTVCEPCRTSLGHARRSLLPLHLPLTSIRIGLPTRSPGLRRSSPGRDLPVHRIITEWIVPGRSGPNRCTCCIPSHTALIVLPFHTYQLLHLTS